MSFLSPRVVLPAHRSADDRLRWGEALPLIIMHATLIIVPFVGVSPAALIALAITYAVRVFALTGGYHRYFSHRTYQTSRVFQFVLAYLGAMAGQLGPLWWASHHRHHHLHSDEVPDAHSPRRRGFFRAHMGWIMCRQNAQADSERVKDLMRFPELRWIDRYHFTAPISLAVGLYVIGEILRRAAGVATTGWQFVAWGFVVSTVLVYHVTFSINSLTHMFGRRRYATNDDSRNSFLLALITMGEGWHNNHHHYPASTRQGFFFWEIDLTYYTLRVLQGIGIVWDIREPPARVYAEARAGRAAAP